MLPIFMLCHVGFQSVIITEFFFFFLIFKNWTRNFCLTSFLLSLNLPKRLVKKLTYIYLCVLISSWLFCVMQENVLQPDPLWKWSLAWKNSVLRALSKLPAMTAKWEQIEDRSCLRFEPFSLIGIIYSITLHDVMTMLSAKEF